MKTIAVTILQLKQLKEETWKTQAYTGIEPMTSAMAERRDLLVLWFSS